MILLVIIHTLIVVINLVSVPLLLVYTPLYVSIPLSSFLIRLATIEKDCPLTRLENYLRRKLGLRTIKTFIGHYIMKYIYIGAGLLNYPNRSNDDSKTT